MSTHRKTLAATFACAAVTLIALPASAAPTDDPAVLPGDVRVWELAHPAGDAPAVLPGDLRAQEQRPPAEVAPPPPAVETQVVTVDDDALELVQIGLGALAGVLGASAVVLVMSSRRNRTTSAGPFGPAATA